MKTKKQAKTGNKAGAADFAKAALAEVQKIAVADGIKKEEAATAAWVAERQYPLVPDEDIVLVSLTGQDYPGLRAAFAEAWDRLHRNWKKFLLTGWREKTAAHPLFPRTPWVIAMPHWPCRELDEFGQTHPSGLSIRFVAPLIERMPEDLAVDVVTREFGYAQYFIHHNVTAGPMWAHFPRSAWDEKVRPTLWLFEKTAGCKNLTKRLAEWAKDESVEALSEKLETDAFWYFKTIGEHAVSIYS